MQRTVTELKAKTENLSSSVRAKQKGDCPTSYHVLHGIEIWPLCLHLQACTQTGPCIMCSWTPTILLLCRAAGPSVQPHL